MCFSPEPKDNAVGDSWKRLVQHRYRSKRFMANLRQTTPEKLEQALRSQGTLLITPKQLDELFARRKSLLRLVDRQVRRVGEKTVLVLP